MMSALLEPADAVGQARRAGDRPRPRAVLVARIGLEGLVRASAKSGSISGSEPASGIRHGSLELARKRSESRITGVRYRTAIRAAS